MIVELPEEHRLSCAVEVANIGTTAAQVVGAGDDDGRLQEVPELVQSLGIPYPDVERGAPLPALGVVASVLPVHMLPGGVVKVNSTAWSEPIGARHR